MADRLDRALLIEAARTLGRPSHYCSPDHKLDVTTPADGCQWVVECSECSCSTYLCDDEIVIRALILQALRRV